MRRRVKDRALRSKAGPCVSQKEEPSAALNNFPSESLPLGEWAYRYIQAEREGDFGEFDILLCLCYLACAGPRQAAKRVSVENARPPGVLHAAER